MGPLSQTNSDWKAVSSRFNIVLQCLFLETPPDYYHIAVFWNCPRATTNVNLHISLLPVIRLLHSYVCLSRDILPFELISPTLASSMFCCSLLPIITNGIFAIFSFMLIMINSKRLQHFHMYCIGACFPWKAERYIAFLPTWERLKVATVLSSYRRILIVSSAQVLSAKRPDLRDIITLQASGVTGERKDNSKTVLVHTCSLLMSFERTSCDILRVQNTNETVTEILLV